MKNRSWRRRGLAVFQAHQRRVDGAKAERGRGLSITAASRQAPNSNPMRSKTQGGQAPALETRARGKSRLARVGPEETLQWPPRLFSSAPGIISVPASIAPPRGSQGVSEPPSHRLPRKAAKGRQPHPQPKAQAAENFESGGIHPPQGLRTSRRLFFGLTDSGGAFRMRGPAPSKRSEEGLSEAWPKLPFAMNDPWPRKERQPSSDRERPPRPRDARRPFLEAARPGPA